MILATIAALLLTLGCTLPTPPPEPPCTRVLRDWETLLCGTPCTGAIWIEASSSVTLGRGEGCAAELERIGVLTVDGGRYE